MLISTFIEAALLLFCGTSHAQAVFTLWRITITTAQQEQAGLGVCSPNSFGGFVDTGVDMTVNGSFTNEACYNMNQLFTPSGSKPLSSCNPSNTSCDFRLTQLSTYNTSANYSRVGFRVGVYSNSTPDPSYLTFRTFQSPNCLQANNSGWHQWNCNALVSNCSVLPYSMQSFSVSRTPADNRSTCLIAGDRGRATVSGGVGQVVNVVVLTIAVLSAVLMLG